VVVDVAYLNLDFGDDLIANFHVNWRSPVKVRSMIIGGSDQSLIYNDLDTSERIRVYDRGISTISDEEKHKSLISYRTGDMYSPNVSHDKPLSIVASDFVRCIRQKKRPLADEESGLRVVRILEAAQRSIKAQGGRIKRGLRAATEGSTSQVGFIRTTHWSSNSSQPIIGHSARRTDEGRPRRWPRVIIAGEI
jgi:predicted dehydrogenase